MSTMHSRYIFRVPTACIFVGYFSLLALSACVAESENSSELSQDDSQIVFKSTVDALKRISLNRYLAQNSVTEQVQEHWDSELASYGNSGINWNIYGDTALRMNVGGSEQGHSLITYGAVVTEPHFTEAVNALGLSLLKRLGENQEASEVSEEQGSMVEQLFPVTNFFVSRFPLSIRINGGDPEYAVINNESLVEAKGPTLQDSVASYLAWIGANMDTETCNDCIVEKIRDLQAQINEETSDWWTEGVLLLFALVVAVVGTVVVLGTIAGSIKSVEVGVVGLVVAVAAVIFVFVRGGSWGEARDMIEALESELDQIKSGVLIPDGCEDSCP